MCFECHLSVSYVTGFVVLVVFSQVCFEYIYWCHTDRLWGSVGNNSRQYNADGRQQPKGLGVHDWWKCEIAQSVAQRSSAGHWAQSHTGLSGWPAFLLELSLSPAPLYLDSCTSELEPLLLTLNPLPLAQPCANNIQRLIQVQKLLHTSCLKSPTIFNKCL